MFYLNQKVKKKGKQDSRCSSAGWCVPRRFENERMLLLTVLAVVVVHHDQ